MLEGVAPFGESGTPGVCLLIILSPHLVRAGPGEEEDQQNEVQRQSSFEVQWWKKQICVFVHKLKSSLQLLRTCLHLTYSGTCICLCNNKPA